MIDGGTRGWRRLGPLLLAIWTALALAPQPAAAAYYQASVYANTSAWSVACGDVGGTIPTKLRSLAVTGLQYLGYAPSAFTGTSFTSSKVLGRVAGDRAIFVHSHGDHYWQGWGFRADGGVCSGTVVTADSIQKLRSATIPASFVLMSTCHLGESGSTMPTAFGIPKVKSQANGVGYVGPRFFMSYVGTAWTLDMLAFETNFWAQIQRGRTVGAAFGAARVATRWTYATTPQWWGSYTYDGRAGATVR